MTNVSNSKFKDFHMGNNLSHPAGGLITSFKLTLEEVNYRKKKVEYILEKYSRIEIADNGNNYCADLSKVKEHQLLRIFKLLEENSILLDAKFYLSKDNYKEFSSISDIMEFILSLKCSLNNNNKEDIYNFIDLEIGGIITDIYISNENGKHILSDSEIEEINALIKYREDFLNFLNYPNGVIIYKTGD